MQDFLEPSIPKTGKWLLLSGNFKLQDNEKETFFYHDACLFHNKHHKLLQQQ